MAAPPTGKLVVSRSREEEEIEARRRHLESLTETVAEKEMELSALRSALDRFQRGYYQVVGRKYVELDALRAQIARRRAELAPENEDSVRESWFRRYRAERSAREYEEYRERHRQEPGPEPPETASGSDEQAKKLYRTIAVQIHPDRAEDESARIYRTALMAELNAAWERGDKARMQAILEEWRRSPEAVNGAGNGAELERLSRTIARFEQRLADLAADIGRIGSSEVGRLMLKVREAKGRGRDLLADLAAELDLKIELARQELEEIN